MSVDEINKAGKNQSEEKIEDKAEEKTLGFFKVLFSVFAAMFGVRGNKYRERDFKHGKASHFILAALVATIIFITVLVFLVKYALSTAGV